MTNDTPLLPSCDIIPCEIEGPHLHAVDPQFAWVPSELSDWERD